MTVVEPAVLRQRRARGGSIPQPITLTGSPRSRSLLRLAQ
jgi:hypothetical protein